MRRLVVLHCLLLFALACGGTTCDCVTPLEAPMADEAKVYDAVQARLTPAAFDFIENNLRTIIDMFIEGGLEFDVPPTSEEFCMLICFDIDICRNGCTLTAEIIDANITPVSPNVLSLDAQVNITGMVDLRGDVDCDVPIHMQNKPVHADIRLLIDPIDHLMYFAIENLQISIGDDDYSLDCSGLLGWLIELLKGVITGIMNDQIQGQLDDALSGALDSAVCLACDFYTGGCPSGSTCGGDYCEQGGTCRKNPLGVVGTVDLTETLGDLGSSAALDVYVAAGQAQDPTVDPMVRTGGVEARLIGGADAAPADCVPTPDPAEIPGSQPPPRFPFSDTVPGTSTTYMAGIGVSDVFLDWFMYKAYLSGLLCLNIGTETTDMLTSSTIGLMGLASLHDLTGGRNTPVKLKIMPTHVPYIEVGAGTLIDDGQGNVTVDEPLLNIFLPGFSMDFYVLLDERWTRIMTVTLDITMGLGMDLTPENMLVFLFGEESITMDNIEVYNYELLAEDPEALKELLPTLVGMALPMLTDALAPIEIPPIEGFLLNIVAIQGDMPRAGTDYYEFMAIYANLEMAPPPPPDARSTRARILQLKVPTLEMMSITRPGGPRYPEIILEVSSGEDKPAEYSWRLDNGLWRPFSPGPQLLVRDPVLALVGTHTLEVRARTPGDYRSLDPTPEKITFEIKPPQVSAEGMRLSARPKTRTLSTTTAARQHTLTEEEPATEGCACGTGAPGGLALLLLLGLALLRRK
jgi:MYXO-CTERM domain-containing protein